MNERENLISLLLRRGFERIPVAFALCPSLLDTMFAHTGSRDPMAFFDFPWRYVPGLPLSREHDPERFRPWHGQLRENTWIDHWGIAHEPGSKEAMHMTRMRNPLSGIDDIERIKQYPFPIFVADNAEEQRAQVQRIHDDGYAAVGNLQCSIWETAWYLRGMEDLMVDMVSECPIASFILDAVTEQGIIQGEAYARAGADIVYLGDDIGMQRTPLMSVGLYRKWLKPRLAEMIGCMKAVKPDIIIIYHSCGYVLPFIDDLIEAGIDVLNPMQPESMDVIAVMDRYGDRLSFHGAVGTQTIMPFGSPEDVRRTVHTFLDAAGLKGGLFPAPTHVLEPEVPWENVMAYVEACKGYKIM